MSESKARTLVGTIVSDKADKTVRVRVDRRTIHPLYGKVIRRRSHMLVHDENNTFKTGDVVTIEESTRVSKNKAWKVTGKHEGNA